VAQPGALAHPCRHGTAPALILFRNNSLGGALVARDNAQPDPTVNDELGSAGHETGIKEPSAVGTAGLYATPIHEEGKEAEAEGQKTADRTAH
jgi:hypothetical protein